MYKVNKKDGVQEDFNDDKLMTGVIKAGGSSEEARKVLDEVKAWLPTTAINNEVVSADLRAKVIESLKTLNPIASSSFEAYTKPME